MLDRLLEQNRAITVFLAENDDKTSKGMSLTARQWTLAARVVKMLKPFDQLTREVSCADACFSMILPATQAILLYLQKDTTDEGIKKTTSEIITSLNKRFADIFGNELFTVSSGLDPRFKVRFLTAFQQLKAKTAIIAATVLLQS